MRDYRRVRPSDYWWWAEIALLGVPVNKIATADGRSTDTIFKALESIKRRPEREPWRVTERTRYKRPYETRPARIKCLSCSRPFDSEHRINNRICPACKKLDNYMPECVVAGRVGGV